MASPMPIRNLFGTAVGVFGITPSEFYRLTPLEYWAAFDAYVISHNLDKRPGSRWSEEEVEEQEAAIAWANERLEEERREREGASSGAT